MNRNIDPIIYPLSSPVRTTSAASYDEGRRQHMLGVYRNMAFGLGITALVALLIASTPALYQPIFGTPLKWVAIFALSPEAKGLAQAMYQSLWSCTTCVVVTILVTLVTKPKPDQELRGLVYSLTDVAQEEHASLFHKPVFWGMLALVLLVILQIIFW